MLPALQERARDELARDLHALRPEEAAVLALLGRRLLEREAEPPRKKRAAVKGRKARRR